MVRVSQPFRTSLSALDDLLQLARRHGARAMKLPQGRVVMASYVPAGRPEWNADPEVGIKALESMEQRAIKRAGIADASAHIQGMSADTAARSPVVAPWSIFPFSPEDCAELICDRMIVRTTMSVDALVESLEDTGLRVETVLPTDNRQLKADKEVLRIGWRDRALTVHADGMTPLLYELLEPDAWAAGVGELLMAIDQPGAPVFVFEGEQKIWRA